MISPVPHVPYDPIQCVVNVYRIHTCGNLLYFAGVYVPSCMCVPNGHTYDIDQRHRSNFKSDKVQPSPTCCSMTTHQLQVSLIIPKRQVILTSIVLHCHHHCPSKNLGLH